ncbi:MAG: class I SAM-dependent methyltransferase [Syntrophomonas sp.]
MDINEQKRYAEQWAKSSEYFYYNNDYDWMCNQIESYRSILEIGCGSGHSTLSLIEHGHSVFSVEKNEYCLEKAKALIKNNGYTYGTVEEKLDECNVIFLLADISDEDFLARLYRASVDIVVCWNVGSYWSKDMLEFYKEKLLIYGLTWEQIRENPESS